MDRREAERFASGLRDARLAGARAAMITIVRVHGNAYRREGAHLFIRDDGDIAGAEWGSILERALANDAAPVIATGEPLIVSYDLADESPLGLGIGCPGTVDVLIERADEDPVLDAWLTTLERGDLAVLITPLSGGAGRRLVYASGFSVGHLDDPGLEQLTDHRAQEWLRESPLKSGAENVDGAEVFFDVSEPPPALVIFGAGHDVEVLARHASWLGFVVLVVDSRGGFLDADRYSGARVLFAPSHHFGDSVVLTPGSFVILMNHHLERDQDALRFSLESDASYIGVLGPRARLRRMLANLAADGYSAPPAVVSRIHSPVGLALGAETPEEVAVSIVAEILAVRRGFSGGFLNGSDDTLHQTRTHRAFGGVV